MYAATSLSFWKCCMAGVLAGSLTLGLGWPTPGHAQSPKPQSPTQAEYFYAMGKSIPALMALDRIGVLIRDGVSMESLQVMMKRRGFELDAEYPRVVIFKIGRGLAKQDLVKLARTIEAKERDFVIQAGLVVTTEGAEAPMLVSDRFIVRLKLDRKDVSIKTLAAKVGAQVVMEDPFNRGTFLLRLNAAAGDSVRTANALHEGGAVEYAHPDFIKPVFDRQVIPNDRLFGNQWHLNNTGQGGGTAGADIRASFAWQVNQGNANTVIAVIDSGFDANHPDFRLWVNPGETAGNGTDEGDANTYIDDVNGWDFTGCDVAMPAANCGDNNVTNGNHGTSVAGAAAARGNNTTGVSGSCPNCSVMLIRNANSDFGQGLAFGYARTMGAAIVTNSWGFGIGTPCTTNLCTAITTAATNGRAGLGAVVLFAMNNPNVNDCGAAPDISSLANVIAVSRSSNFDRFDFSGFGNCMDVLAPSAGTNTVAAGRGTLWITTTDRIGANGYNNGSAPGSCPTAAALPPPADAQNYTDCFNGTSAATPITAGVVGLILTADNTLTRAQVQNVLQDTADKVEDSAGVYALANGFSSPAAGQATHGYGRVNADEAVRVVAPVAAGGKNGVDVFLRDNRLDWGNMQRSSNLLFENPRGFIPHWESVDIKIDSPSDGYRTPPTAATFDAFSDETPSAVTGDVNRVYVRVRNRGPRSAAQVNVKLHWSQFGAGLPALPGDFWGAFPNNSTDTSRWHPLDCTVAPPSGVPATVCRVANLGYSGASVAGTLSDAAQIVQFDFPAPGIDPMLDNHFCLMAVVDSPQDPVSMRSRASTVVDDITPNDNNVTHRNYANLSSTRSDRFERAFFIRNPFSRDIQTEFHIDAPKGWNIATVPMRAGTSVKLAPGEERRIDIRIALPATEASGTITVTQWLLEEKRPLGGLTFGVRPDRPATPPSGLVDVASVYLVGTYDVRPDRRTQVEIVNPGAKPVRVLVSLFDSAGNPAGCTTGSVGANGRMDVDVAKHVRKGTTGVVKVVGLDVERDVPSGPIVGNQGLAHRAVGLSTTGLHPVATSTLLEDWPRIAAACGR